MDRFAQTDNVMSTYSKEVGGDYPVFVRKGANLHGGGLVKVADIPTDTGVLQEGTMLIFNGIGEEVTIVKSTDADNLAKVNGILAERIRIPLDKTVIDVTCAVTREGVIYADRADIPAAVRALPVFAKMEFISEA